MRILDLGAHDGFVGTWLAQQVPGLHIDGIEANSEGVQRANARAAKHKISGTYVQGLAEDARRLFKRGTYDVVVAYELIEHVPSVDRFLDSCEEMLVPGGIVYLSTPNGTFGQGNNPHHLRVYRAFDFYEVCRRRGSVINMIAGDDGVSVIAYRPDADENMLGELAIYCGPGWEKWHPKDADNKGLGGSETAAVRLGEGLSNLGYTVTVYGDCDHCAWRQVAFKPHHTFDPLEERRVVVSSRTPWLVDRPIQAEHTLLWMHDTDYGNALTKERADRFDGIAVLSDWHKGYVLEKYPFLENVFVTGNAIDGRYFQNKADETRPPVALYSSSPDRGLDIMLEIWPEVRKQVPDAELQYCYANVYDKVADKNPVIAAFRDRVKKLAAQPGVKNLGSLPQPVVAQAMQSVAVWLAPSYSTPVGAKFFETYCIGALEAAAGGACIIASDWGALPERTEDAVNSVLIPAPEGNGDIRRDEWVSAIVNAMTMTTPQPSPAALETTWDERAMEFNRVIELGVAVPSRA